jgi:hypothetical protein
MESLKAKYKIGTRVEYKLKNHNISLQFGIIKGSYDGLDNVYYTILKDDGTTSEVPEELLVEINNSDRTSDKPNIVINNWNEEYGYETFDMM